MLWTHSESMESRMKVTDVAVKKIKLTLKTPVTQQIYGSLKRGLAIPGSFYWIFDIMMMSFVLIFIFRIFQGLVSVKEN